jgi:hypothetical protein
MRKMWKGRRKNKRFCNEMDDMEMGYGNDMYSSGDFNQIKNKLCCSVYHGEGHTMNRHKQGPRGTQGRMAPQVKIIDWWQPLS